MLELAVSACVHNMQSVPESGSEVKEKAER